MSEDGGRAGGVGVLLVALLGRLLHQGLLGVEVPGAVQPALEEEHPLVGLDVRVGARVVHHTGIDVEHRAGAVDAAHLGLPRVQAPLGAVEAGRHRHRPHVPHPRGVVGPLERRGVGAGDTSGVLDRLLAQGADLPHHEPSATDRCPLVDRTGVWAGDGHGGRSEVGDVEDRGEDPSSAQRDGDSSQHGGSPRWTRSLQKPCFPVNRRIPGGDRAGAVIDPRPGGPRSPGRRRSRRVARHRPGPARRTPGSDRTRTPPRGCRWARSGRGWPTSRRPG